MANRGRRLCGLTASRSWRAPLRLLTPPQSAGLAGQRQFGANPNPKRKRGNDLCEIPRSRFGLRKTGPSTRKWRCPVRAACENPCSRTRPIWMTSKPPVEHVSERLALTAVSEEFCRARNTSRIQVGWQNFGGSPAWRWRETTIRGLDRKC